MADLPPILVIGLGNDFRSDDSVGLLAARKIRDKALPAVCVIDGVSDGVSLIDTWSASDHVFVIDCAVSGAEPGCVHKFDALNESVPDHLFSRYSTHAFSVSDALTLARTLGRLPAALSVYGIEAAGCAPGTDLSPAVAASLDTVVGEILAAIGNCRVT